LIETVRGAGYRWRPQRHQPNFHFSGRR
jgi:hypothetical protein